MLNLEDNSAIALFNNSHSIIKIILFLIIWAVIWFPIAIPLARLVKWQIAAPISNTQKLTFIISLYSLVPLLTWVILKVEEIPISAIGLIFESSFFKSILFGYSLGIFSIVFVYSLELWAGWLIFNHDNQRRVNGLNLPLILCLSLFISTIEELTFRGIFVHFLRANFTWWWVAIISSLIFALLHLIWEQKNTLPQLPGLFLMGLVLYYAVTINNGNLGLAIGLHGGWVFLLACLDTFNLFDYNKDASAWLIGKKDQPLGSIAGLMVLFVTLVLQLVIHLPRLG